MFIGKSIRLNKIIELEEININTIEEFLKGKNMENNNILISVIIPMYNAEKTLDRCLGSILNQSYKNLEIIIVNDGSTDNSVKKVEEYQKSDSRIRIYHEQNSGVSHARNEGLKHISGDYVQFVDSDDDLDLDYFKIQLSRIIETGADMAICNNKHPFFMTYLDDRVYDLTKHDDFIELYQHTYAATLPWNKLIKVEALKGVDFAENIKFAEDELFFCNLVKNIKKVVTTSKVLYHYFLAQATNGEEEKSAINDIINSSKFWEYKTSFYYKGLLCIPSRLRYFQEAINQKKIPITDITEILYIRVFDYAFFQYAGYAGFKVPEENMYKEMMNIFTDAFFYESVKTQERYGLKFFDFNSKDLAIKVKEINHYIYEAYQDIYIHQLNLKPTYVAFSIFTKLFVLEDNDIFNVNFINKLDKDLRYNLTPEAQYVNKLIK